MVYLVGDAVTQPRLRVVPLELPELNALVARLHRHHKPVQGHRFSIGVVDAETDRIAGGASVGRPVARLTNAKEVLEITRLVTDGTPNACSALYAAVCRIQRALGYKRTQTFILGAEPGTSLRAAGWRFAELTGGDDWTRKRRPDRRRDQPLGPKQRWVCACA